MAAAIVKRIFGNRKLPEGLSEREYDAYMNEHFPQWITEFEESGFLEANKLRGTLDGEADLLRALRTHKERGELVVVKFWKRGCLPCLGLAEMFKEAERRYEAQGRKVVFYAVNTKSAPARDLVRFQMIEGTPALQTFYGGRQVGDEIRAMNIDELMREIDARFASVSAAAAS